jgi:hypothetical protein
VILIFKRYELDDLLGVAQRVGSAWYLAGSPVPSPSHAARAFRHIQRQPYINLTPKRYVN